MSISRKNGLLKGLKKQPTFKTRLEAISPESYGLSTLIEPAGQTSIRKTSKYVANVENDPDLRAQMLKHQKLI